MKMCKNHRNKSLLSRTIVEKYLISDKRHFLRFLKGWSSQGNWGFSWTIFIKCGTKNVWIRIWNLEGVPIIKIWRSIFRKQNSGFPLWKRQKLILFKICLFFSFLSWLKFVRFRFKKPVFLVLLDLQKLN